MLVLLNNTFTSYDDNTRVFSAGPDMIFSFHSFIRKWIAKIKIEFVHHRVFEYVKNVLIRSFSGPHFLTLGLNTEIYWVNLRIQSEYVKMRTRKLRIRTLFTHCSIDRNTLTLLPNQVLTNCLILYFCMLLLPYVFCFTFSFNFTKKVNIYFLYILSAVK